MTKIPFGKYKGKLLNEVPKQYVKWMYRNCELYGTFKEEVAKLADKYEGGDVFDNGMSDYMENSLSYSDFFGR